MSDDKHTTVRWGQDVRCTVCGCQWDANDDAPEQCIPEKPDEAPKSIPTDDEDVGPMVPRRNIGPTYRSPYMTWMPRGDI